MGEAWHVCNQSSILELWAQILPSLPVVEHHVRHFRVRSELNWNQKFIILVDLIQQLVETGPLFGCGKLLCSFIDIFVFAFFLVFGFWIYVSFFLQCSKKGRNWTNRWQNLPGEIAHDFLRLWGVFSSIVFHLICSKKRPFVADVTQIAWIGVPYLRRVWATECLRFAVFCADSGLPVFPDSAPALVTFPPRFPPFSRSRHFW